MEHRFYHQCVVVDNSVILKAFIDEQYSAYVDGLICMNLRRDITFIAPSILLYEFFNVISRAYSGFDDVGMAYNKFKTLNFTLVEPDDFVLIEASKSLFENHGISYYDAVYHALARNMNATFLTADKRYFDLMKKKGNIEYLGNLAKK